MRNLLAVAMLTIAQFTAFPFVAMVAANSARHADVQKVEPANVTVVYKTDQRRSVL